MSKTLPIEFLRECFTYSPETGELRWNVRPLHHFSSEASMRSFHSRFAGKVTGAKRPDGYLDVFVAGRPFLAHRIIYALVHGEWPVVLDHINGDKADNRIVNLRTCTFAENIRNQGRKRTSTSPLKGAYWHKARKRWQSTICLGGKQVALGYFGSAEEAHAAYCAAAHIHHGEFANTGEVAA